jgi:PAS domain S-box-containing protein
MPEKNDRTDSDRMKAVRLKKAVSANGTAGTLRKNGAVCQSILEALPDLLFLLSKDGTFLDYHKPVSSFLLASPEQLLGRSVAEVLPKKLTEKMVTLGKRVFKTGKVQHLEYPLRVSGRNYFFETWLTCCDQDKILAIIRNITKRKKAEKAFKENEEHLRSLLKNAVNFVIYRVNYDNSDPSGLRAVLVSPSMTEITGIAEPMKVETWFDRVHPDDLKRVLKGRRQSFKTLKFDEVFRIFHPSKKEWRWVRVISTGIPDEEGRTTYVNGIITDITEKMRADEALLQAHEQLELRVKERTEQLVRINEKLTKEIKVRKLAETALERSEKRLRLLSNRLIHAQEKERKRIAIELHDELGQSLVGLKFQMSNFSKKLKRNQGELRQEIDQALHYLDSITENVRRLSRDLLPSVLEHLGLWEALQWLFDKSARQYGFKIIHDIGKIRFSFSQEQELIIFRIFQEALTNIKKHAQAEEVVIQVYGRGDEAVFSIQDNGKGFNQKEIKNRNLSEIGLGLTAMEERARMAGGTLSVWSRRNKGTKITFTTPTSRSREKTR